MGHLMDSRGLTQGSPPSLRHAGWERMGAEPAGVGASSPPLLSRLQLAVELHPGKSCHGPGTSTTVQQEPGQPRVSGDTGGQVPGSVLLLGSAPGLCPHAAPRWLCQLPPLVHPVSPSHAPGRRCCLGKAGTLCPVLAAHLPAPGCLGHGQTQHSCVLACRRTPSETREWLPSPLR